MQWIELLSNNDLSNNDPCWGYVVLRCTFNNAIADESSYERALLLNRVSGSYPIPSLSTTNKFGGKSLLLHRFNWVDVQVNSSMTIGTQDFCLEAWVYITAYGDYVADFLGDGTSAITSSTSLFFAGPGNWYLRGRVYSGSSYVEVSTYISNDTGAGFFNAWHHVALVRNGTSLKLYLDGVCNFGGSSTLAGGYTVRAPVNTNWNIGSKDGGPYGFIDDLRFTIGCPRYITDFTPPTSELQVS